MKLVFFALLVLTFSAHASFSEYREISCDHELVKYLALDDDLSALESVSNYEASSGRLVFKLSSVEYLESIEIGYYDVYLTWNKSKPVRKIGNVTGGFRGKFLAFNMNMVDGWGDYAIYNLRTKKLSRHNSFELEDGKIKQSYWVYDCS